MNPKEQLQSILHNQYIDDDGEAYEVKLAPGMDEKELSEFRAKLPNHHLADEVADLLKFSRGFEFYGLEKIRFDAFGQFEFNELFPRSIQLASDGFGNFWVLDIDEQGNWNSVYYVCYDPAVVIKHSENLAEFIHHVDEFRKTGKESNLDIIHEKTVMEVWHQNIDSDSPEYDFSELQITFPDEYFVADLTEKPVKAGFAWGKSGSDGRIIRPSAKPVWIVGKKSRQRFL